MKESIFIQDFPGFVRFRIGEDLLARLFDGAAASLVNKELDRGALSDALEGDPWDPSFLFGDVEGRIIAALKESEIGSGPLLERTKAPMSTLHHKLSKLSRAGIIEKVNGKYKLQQDGLYGFANFRGRGSLDPGKRRGKGVSKEEVALALFLWPRYREACAKEGIAVGSTRYAAAYKDVFALAQAIKLWKRGYFGIPQWALVVLAELGGEVDALNEPGVIASYFIPPGLEVKPHYNGDYKIPVQSGVEMDIALMQLLAKGANGGRAYHHVNKKEFFRKLRSIFGDFQSSNGRIPLAIVEILKRNYGLSELEKRTAEIPKVARNRIEGSNGLERTRLEIELLGGALKLCSGSRNLELTSRSKKFLSDVSSLAQELGIEGFRISKRNGRPHYRCNVPKAIAAFAKHPKGFVEAYEKAKKLYPDLAIWERIPMNRIREKLLGKSLSKAVVEAACREALAEHITDILKSMDRDRPIDLPHYAQEDTEELTRYFWDAKKVPVIRNIKEYLEARRFAHREEMAEILSGL